MNTIISNMVTILGGNKALAMTGGTFSADESSNTLYFKYKGSRKTNCLTFVYDSVMDLYTMTFQKIKKFDIIVIEEVRMVYADQVKRIFTETTGLELSL